MFLHQKNFKTALKVDLRQLSSRHRRRRHRYRRRHRRSGSSVQKKMKDVFVGHGKQEDAEKKSLTVCPSSSVFRCRRRRRS
ncbi:hypothetical protein [Absidia glauca]|uniref:Uncharacterized protein n=1 Tax=Absidia glauca TaxID=4829 RepID=A0A168PFC6_ABSGL|nr:hypothetical protein [Absidia glauca]